MGGKNKNPMDGLNSIPYDWYATFLEADIILFKTNKGKVQRKDRERKGKVMKSMVDCWHGIETFLFVIMIT